MRARTVFEENTLKGGKGDKITSEDVCPKQLAVGKKVEKEHASSIKKATEIALDHLKEDPKYYSKLVEKGFVDEDPAIKEYIKQFGKEKLPKKLMKETQNFERGQDPKKTMGIGGIDLFNDLEERLDELDMTIGMEKMTAGELYQEFLEKTLVGKTITAEMKKLPQFNTKTGKNTGGYENGEFTVKVTDVKLGEEMREMYDRYKMAGFSPQIILAGDDNRVYALSMREGQKIHFN